MSKKVYGYFPVPKKFKNHFLDSLKDINRTYDSGEYPFEYIDWINQLERARWKTKVSEDELL